VNGLAVKFVGCAAATEPDAPEPQEMTAAQAEHVARCVKCQDALECRCHPAVRDEGKPEGRRAVRDGRVSIVVSLRESAYLRRAQAGSMEGGA